MTKTILLAESIGCLRLLSGIILCRILRVWLLATNGSVLLVRILFVYLILLAMNCIPYALIVYSWLSAPMKTP